MANDINQAVREVCLSFPEAEEFLSHGSPNFRVRGKTFAMYAVNHHGDGRVALWLSSPPGAQTVLKSLRKTCLALPETSEARQFGSPVWRAGKKGFALAYYNAKWLKLSFWVGVDRQGLFTADERFQIPAYMGHNGWIELDVNDTCNWDEVKALAHASYEHFALKRMLRKS